MRRLWTMFVALGLLSAVLGCRHTAGVCDCGDSCHSCGYHPGGIITPEPLPVMPKVKNGDGKPKEIQFEKELPLGNGT
ncbi:MAG: hypothetical protein KatS3mg105_3443 [Gemmatales bacterium]|nr:MAG: hypothetical protein KatS3mg105_3443 [Gemmatales bacterium]